VPDDEPSAKVEGSFVDDTPGCAKATMARRSRFSCSTTIEAQPPRRGSLATITTASA
jgi:hypothetical protein